MSQGARNWPFLTLIALAGLRRGDQQIGLPAEEGRDLQHVDHLGDQRALLGIVHVGDHRQADLLADLGEDRQRRIEADAARDPARLVRLALSKEVL